MKTQNLTTGQAWDAVAEGNGEVYAKSDHVSYGTIYIRYITGGSVGSHDKWHMQATRRWSLHYTATDLPVPEPDVLVGHTAESFDTTPGRALRYDEVRAALGVPCVVETLKREFDPNAGWQSIAYTRDWKTAGHSWTYRIAPVAETHPVCSSCNGTVEWRYDAGKFDVDPCPKFRGSKVEPKDPPPAEPAVILGPSAIATVYADGKPEEWEANRSDDGWWPYSKWMFWDHHAVVTATLFRRRPDPFAGIELPEGYRIQEVRPDCVIIEYNGGLNHCMVRSGGVEFFTQRICWFKEEIASNQRAITTLKLELSVAKRLRELEAAK
jgi:hypothetical protein